MLTANQRLALGPRLGPSHLGGVPLVAAIVAPSSTACTFARSMPCYGGVLLRWVNGSSPRIPRPSSDTRVQAT